MNTTKCFADTPIRGCKAIDTPMVGNRCPGYAACPFYKTVDQQRLDKQAARERIAALSPEHRRYIAEKYYRGETPWEPGGANV